MNPILSILGTLIGGAVMMFIIVIGFNYMIMMAHIGLIIGGVVIAGAACLFIAFLVLGGIAKLFPSKEVRKLNREIQETQIQIGKRQYEYEASIGLHDTTWITVLWGGLLILPAIAGIGVGAWMLSEIVPNVSNISLTKTAVYSAGTSVVLYILLIPAYTLLNWLDTARKQEILKTHGLSNLAPEEIRIHQAVWARIRVFIYLFGSVFIGIFVALGAYREFHVLGFAIFIGISVVALLDFIRKFIPYFQVQDN